VRLWIVSALCFAATLALGAFVAHRAPTPLDLAGASLRGHGVPLALFFTALGRWPVLLSLGVLALGIAFSVRADAAPVLVLLGTQVASQGANALVKTGFHRLRPEAFVLIRERDFSYPSGHAVTAIVFFIGFGILAWHAPLPRPLQLLLTGVLVACALGIPWSRVALGAHYVTDVAGGLAFGTAWLCAAAAAYWSAISRIRLG